MDKESSLEMRYSFNIAQGTPVAESTHLSGSSFSWGSSRSPKHGSNYSLYANGIQTTPSLDNETTLSPKMKSLTKIDARVAADIQSKGLASRIVKYHDSGTRLNRSVSAHNLYSKPGQFPSVTLKKTELPYRAAKQELSMVRIPPPEKSSYYGNTISSLLRSSSVLGLQSKRNEDLSRENRPIIHPPPTEDDMAPTRSVLDVLKEISRKRINSDNLEMEENSKKYCNRGGNDLTDTVNNKISRIQQNFIASTLACQRYKRQRNCVTAYHDVQRPETQVSPEQAKKRVCNYNNDIMSSLSSSMKWKRITASHNSNHTISNEMPNVQGYQDYHKSENNARVDMRFENLESNIRKLDKINPITPIPETPCVPEQNNIHGIELKRSISEQSYNLEQNPTNSSTQSTNKPRLTLFNKICDESQNKGTNESCEILSESTDSAGDLNDCTGIPFVKPKKIISKSGLRNPIIERAQQSKLALMLSGLKGELYINYDVDEFDSPKQKETFQVPEKNNENINAITAISDAISINTETTLTTAKSSSNIESSNPSNILSLSTKTSLSSPSIVSSVNKTSSPLVGLKMTPSNPSPENNSVDFTKMSENQSKPNVPILGGFSFSANNSTLMVETSPPNNVVKGSEKTKTPISSVATNSNHVLDVGPVNDIGRSLDDGVNKLPIDIQTSAASTINPSTSSNTAINVSETTTVGSTPGFNATAKPNSVFNFTVPSTSLPISSISTAPITFGGSTCSSTLPIKTISTSNAAATSNAITFSTVISENLNGSTSTPSFSFNTNKKTLPSGNAKVSPTATITANGLHTFGTNFNLTTETQPASSSFNFNSDTKNLNFSSCGQTNPEVPKHTGSNIFQSNTTKLFDSQSFKTKESDGSNVSLGNATNIFQSVFNSSTTTPNFSSSGIKADMQTFGSSTNNKPPTIFESKSDNKAPSTLFSFGSKSIPAPTVSTNNMSIAPGGFSFTSAVSNTNENRVFGSNGQTNTLNTTFNGTSASDTQNAFKFGSSANKLDNSANIFNNAVNKQAEVGGFSFGSVTAPKSTFSFGASNISTVNAVTSSNIPSTGFTFGAPVTKTNETPSNKSFTFGSPQPTQQKQSDLVPISNSSSLKMFGLSDISKTTQSPAFNFIAGNATQNLQSNASTTQTMYATPASTITTGPGDRPIRRATRRLQK